MNIKELVLVISILLSIRIAEYAMKKYKEQKDVEVTKKQKSRKQTKKYIITAPSILKVGLPCGIFFGCTTIAFILSPSNPAKAGTAKATESTRVDKVS